MIQITDNVVRMKKLAKKMIEKSKQSSRGNT